MDFKEQLTLICLYDRHTVAFNGVTRLVTFHAFAHDQYSQFSLIRASLDARMPVSQSCR